MSQTTPLSEIARYAFNQLLAGTSIDEVYDNLNIDDRLNDAELIELKVILCGKADGQGLFSDDDHLRPRTVLELFLNVNTELLTATLAADSQVTLEVGGVVMLIHLSNIPELIIKQVAPPEVSSFLAYVYFKNIGRVA